jgi:predicted DNA-binding transcriptional regulator YafY
MAVTVRVEAGALPRLRELVPVHGQNRIPLTCTRQIDVTIPFASEDWACAALLSLGRAVEVRQPPAIRERVADQARGAAAHYTRQLAGQICYLARRHTSVVNGGTHRDGDRRLGR